MSTTRGRLIAPAQVVYDQADFFQNDGFTRVLGLTQASLGLQVYLNNALQGWTLVGGSTITDAQVVSGKVYFSAISGGPYNLRWRPNGVGYWRILLTYAPGNQILGQDYDVTVQSQTSQGSGEGLHTSFIRPGDRNGR